MDPLIQFVGVPAPVREDDPLLQNIVEMQPIDVWQLSAIDQFHFFMGIGVIGFKKLSIFTLRLSFQILTRVIRQSFNLLFSGMGSFRQFLSGIIFDDPRHDDDNHDRLLLAEDFNPHG